MSMDPPQGCIEVSKVHVEREVRHMWGSLDTALLFMILLILLPLLLMSVNSNRDESSTF